MVGKFTGGQTMIKANMNPQVEISDSVMEQVRRNRIEQAETLQAVGRPVDATKPDLTPYELTLTPLVEHALTHHVADASREQLIDALNYLAVQVRELEENHRLATINLMIAQGLATSWAEHAFTHREVERARADIRKGKTATAAADRHAAVLSLLQTRFDNAQPKPKINQIPGLLWVQGGKGSRRIDRSHPEGVPWSEKAIIESLSAIADQNPYK